MEFLKEFFEKDDFEKISRQLKSMENFPEDKELTMSGRCDYYMFDLILMSHQQYFVYKGTGLPVLNQY